MNISDATTTATIKENTVMTQVTVDFRDDLCNRTPPEIYTRPEFSEGEEHMDAHEPSVLEDCNFVLGLEATNTDGSVVAL
jgi:hypothetical protein